MSPPATQECLFCARAAMIAAAIACLLQPTSAFISNGVAVFAGSHTTPTPTLPSNREALTVTRHTYRHVDGASGGAARRLRRSVLMVTAAAPAPGAAERLSPATTSKQVGVGAAAAAAAATTGVGGSVLERVKKPLRSLAEAKREMLHLFSLSSAGVELTSDQEERAGFLLETLEGNFTPIQTVGFFNLAVQGDWHLAYTNTPMRPIGPRFEVSELYQKIAAGEGGEGSLMNVLEWKLLDEDVGGRFEVDCGYRLDPRGRMNASVLEHRLVPTNKMPQDPQELVRLLQRAMPQEMFDPDAHALDITFMDESVRIVRMRGAKLEGRLNVFARKSALPPQPPSSPPLPLVEPKREGEETG